MAIHSLPRTTRIAMLQGIAANDIIVGAYTNGQGICPMLAAHRNGGRTNLISFAKAWDRYAFSGTRVTKPRPATPRELLVLRTHLEASLLEEDTPTADLAAAIESHQRLASRRERAQAPPPAARRRQPRPGDPARRRQPRPGDPDRSQELRSRPGWSWTRLFRRYDEYRWALEQVQAEGHWQDQVGLRSATAASPERPQEQTPVVS